MKRIDMINLTKILENTKTRTSLSILACALDDGAVRQSEIKEWDSDQFTLTHYSFKGGISYKVRGDIISINGGAENVLDEDTVYKISRFLNNRFELEKSNNSQKDSGEEKTM